MGTIATLCVHVGPETAGRGRTCFAHPTCARTARQRPWQCPPNPTSPPPIPPASGVHSDDGGLAKVCSASIGESPTIPFGAAPSVLPTVQRGRLSAPIPHRAGTPGTGHRAPGTGQDATAQRPVAPTGQLNRLSIAPRPSWHHHTAAVAPTGQLHRDTDDPTQRARARPAGAPIKSDSATQKQQRRRGGPRRAPTTTPAHARDPPIRGGRREQRGRAGAAAGRNPSTGA